jgi:hypothetical protein
VSEPIQHAGPVTDIQFSPDGRLCLSIASLDSLRLWELTEPPLPVPAWFCEFVEAVSGKRINARREAETVSRESILLFRRKLTGTQETDFYSRWANWFLHERTRDRVPVFGP